MDNRGIKGFLVSGTWMMPACLTPESTTSKRCYLMNENHRLINVHQYFIILTSPKVHAPLRSRLLVRQLPITKKHLNIYQQVTAYLRHAHCRKLTSKTTEKRPPTPMLGDGGVLEVRVTSSGGTLWHQSEGWEVESCMILELTVSVLG